MGCAEGAGGFLAISVACSPGAGLVDQVELRVAPGTTLREAIERSGLLVKHPFLSLGPGFLGIWGRLAEADAPLRDGDRVEIYRGLAVDPMEARRLRQRRQKATCSRRR